MRPVVLGWLLSHVLTFRALRLQAAQDPVPLSMLHIAKTAGRSLQFDLPKHVYPVQWLGEHCVSKFNAVPKKMTFLRDPRAHVYSQWMHCRDDKGHWFRPKDLPSNFTGWLQHWLRTGDKPQRAQTFHCYHPMNMQSRILSCSREGPLACVAPGMDSYILNDDKGEFVEKFELAARRLKEMHFVGITEFYQESLCALHVKENGRFPAWCNCEDVKSWKRFPMSPPKTHGGRPHGPVEVDVDPHDIKLIDSLTLDDSKLHSIAIQRLRDDIAKIERTWNKRIWCHQDGRKSAKDSVTLQSWDYDDSDVAPQETGLQLLRDPDCICGCST